MPGHSSLIFERLVVKLNVEVNDTDSFQPNFSYSAIFPKSQWPFFRAGIATIATIAEG